MKSITYQGAWLTDIDDTLVLSGEIPGKELLASLAEFIGILKEHGILWIPMSGVALVKLGPRILFHLPEALLSHVHYYGGDGSLKYYFCTDDGRWKEDDRFSRLFSDAQARMILGEEDFRSALEQEARLTGQDTAGIGPRMEQTLGFLKEKGYDPDDAVLDRLKRKLRDAGYDPSASETYFRGGSVSWMMLGDVAAEPYHKPEAAALRKELIRISRLWLQERDFLGDLGSLGIDVPFPGARGIKFVLKGNDKERAARDLLTWTGLEPEEILFAGNELFDGGNDNMLRKINGVTLLSVGDREDPGPGVIPGRRNRGGLTLEGVDANRWWMDWTWKRLESGTPWKEILREMGAKGNG